VNVLSGDVCWTPCKKNVAKPSYRALPEVWVTNHIQYANTVPCCAALTSGTGVISTLFPICLLNITTLHSDFTWDSLAPAARHHATRTTTVEPSDVPPHWVTGWIGYNSGTLWCPSTLGYGLDRVQQWNPLCPSTLGHGLDRVQQAQWIMKGSMIWLCTNYHKDDEIKEDDIGRACRAHWRNKNAHKILVGNP
jgi:hypothetical protein